MRVGYTVTRILPRPPGAPNAAYTQAVACFFYMMRVQLISVFSPLIHFQLYSISFTHGSDPRDPEYYRE